MTTTTKRKPIRTDEQGLAYLEEMHPDALAAYLTGTGEIVVPTPCYRCGGSGYGPWYVDGGICFKCHGADTRNSKTTYSPKAYAQKLKRGDTARAKKVAERKAIADAKAAAGLSFLACRPKLAKALKADHRISRDLADKVALYGSISEAQIALAMKIANDIAHPEATTDAPEGRVEFTGTIVSAKETFSDYGTNWRVTVKVETEYGVWLANGNAPSSLLDSVEWIREDEYGGDREPQLKGMTLTLRATLTRSDDKAHFAFFKRPHYRAAA
jgi:ribosomal protein L9